MGVGILEGLNRRPGGRWRWVCSAPAAALNQAVAQGVVGRPASALSTSPICTLHRRESAQALVTAVAQSIVAPGQPVRRHPGRHVGEAHAAPIIAVFPRRIAAVDASLPREVAEVDGTAICACVLLAVPW